MKTSVCHPVWLRFISTVTSERWHLALHSSLRKQPLCQKPQARRTLLLLLIAAWRSEGNSEQTPLCLGNNVCVSIKILFRIFNLSLSELQGQSFFMFLFFWTQTLSFQNLPNFFPQPEVRQRSQSVCFHGRTLAGRQNRTVSARCTVRFVTAKIFCST